MTDTTETAKVYWW